MPPSKQDSKRDFINDFLVFCCPLITLKLPKDANFRITKAKVTLGRGGRAVTSVNVTTENIGTQLAALAGQARAGDILQIETIEVKRANFQSNIENFPNYSGKFISVEIK